MSEVPLQCEKCVGKPLSLMIAVPLKRNRSTFFQDYLKNHKHMCTRVQGYPTPPLPWDHQRPLGRVPLKSPRKVRFLMIEVPLYRSFSDAASVGVHAWRPCW